MSLYHRAHFLLKSQNPVQICHDLPFREVLLPKRPIHTLCVLSWDGFGQVNILSLICAVALVPNIGNYKCPGTHNVALCAFGGCLQALRLAPNAASRAPTDGILTKATDELGEGARSRCRPRMCI